MSRPRVIPILLLDGNDLVKTKKFGNKQYIGDPINAIKIFNEKEIDELVLLDISASQRNTGPNIQFIEQLASECFVPLSYGGGISNIEQASMLFKAGVEKLIINSSSHSNPSLISEISEKFGKQSVCVCIDFKKNWKGSFNVYKNRGKQNTGIDPIQFAIDMEKAGAGELIINSIDREGSYDGYELEIIRKISNVVNIPVIASGGAGKLEDLRSGIEYGASAVAAGSLFCFWGNLKAVLINYPSQTELKELFKKAFDPQKKALKVLHFSPWYPTPDHPQKALFIKEHIDSLEEICENKLIHIEIAAGITGKKILISEREESIQINSRFKIWRLIELIAFIEIIKYLFKEENKKYNLINFHIAYPLATKIKAIKLFFKKPVIITEHWTAYHFNFHTSLNNKGLKRIKNIFSKDIPVIVVSEALGKDITNFSGIQQIRFHVVPNIINNATFNCQIREFPPIPTFFMLNMWSVIKQPFVGIDAFEEFLKTYPKAILKIGGFGPLWGEIEQYIVSKKLTNSVQLLGPMSKAQIASELNSSTALLHTSLYETFSVISAESICCGTPVIALNKGGIPSFVNGKNGILHNDNTINGWKNGMIELVSNLNNYNRVDISQNAHSIFEKCKVGEKYYHVLKQEYTRYFSL